MYIKPKLMTLTPGGSIDETGARVRIVPAGDPEPAQDFPYFEVNKDGYVDIDLNTLAGPIDGVYDIWVSTVDDAGNEGAGVVAAGVPLDNVAPEQIGAINISDTPQK